MGKRPKPPSENCVVTGDIVSVILDYDVNPGGTITPTAETVAEITLGTQVVLWLSENVIAIDEWLLESHMIGEASGYELWPSAEEPPNWIGFDPAEPPYPSNSLNPIHENPDGVMGRYYFGVAQLSDGIYDGRLDFEFSPHGPCTPRPWGTTSPVPDNPQLWADWRLALEQDPDLPPPLCPFLLLLLGGEKDASGNVTFFDTSEFFYVRKGGYPRVMLADFTLGPPCPEEKKPGKGKKNSSSPGTMPEGFCIRGDGYTVGTGPVVNPIVFNFAQN
jgi:hypothetical protein